MIKSFKRFIVKMTACAVIFTLLISCSDDSKKELSSDVAITLSQESAGSEAGSQFVSVIAPGAWTLSVNYDGAQSDWVRFSISSGNGSKGSIVMSWTANEADEQRDCKVVLTCAGVSKEAVFSQRAKGQFTTAISSLKPDPYASWLELPAIQDGDGRYFFSHTMTVGKYTGRNYSFYLDADAKVSVWVAYPLNKGLIGTNSGRTDDWGLDPKVPRAYQSVIYSAYRGGYQRGHQLPSADRYGNNNSSTFYGTNMTPQKGELNEHAWAKLEGYVRSWSYTFDTLYVVTGADISRGNDWATDNDGKKIKVPVGYFKALLGYKKGGTHPSSVAAQTGGYTSIAFYMDHKSYSDNAIMGTSMSVKELEQMTGFDFFANLPGKTSAATADKIESAKDSWWGSNI
ncbi:MAG: DNA/RNA non-specific endonuclease [Bacteroidales bacterium]|nr:DNA/RNA non-specific endonuclease [Bacteroidales bacterium]